MIDERTLPRLAPVALTVDDTVGRLDRLLSEFLWLVESDVLDQVDAQTLKHHADDLIGVGQSALKKLKARGAA